MKLIELHIIQSFPVSCLNRDEVGSPKTAIFGGIPRARISSQCLKRAIRLCARELQPDMFAAERTKLFIAPLAQRLRDRKIDEDRALELSRAVGKHLATLDEKAAKKGVEKVKTLMFLSPAELDEIAEKLAADDGGDISKQVTAACKKAALKDGADVAIFGRMVASDHSLTVEAAGMFAHALTTHRAENDIDFFSAVDDRRDDRRAEDRTLSEEEEAGAGMIGTLEFASGAFYRYAALNLDLLFYQANDNGQLPANLQCLADADKQAERRKLVETFVRATVMAVPNARKNSMNANTLPAYVLGVVKDSGQPIQLVNAFEAGVRAKNGLIEPSVAAELLHLHRMKTIFNVEHALEIATGIHKPEANGAGLTKEMVPKHVDLNTFCAEISKHVE